MLQLFRQKKNWLKWILVLAIAALGISTVFLFVGPPTGAPTGLAAQDVAVVAGESISGQVCYRFPTAQLDSMVLVASATWPRGRY